MRKKVMNPSFHGHAPGKDTLRAANAAMKERFTGRKQNKRKRLPVVVPVLICLFVKIKTSFPGHAPGKDTLRAANAAMKERFTGRKQGHT